MSRPVLAPRYLRTIQRHPLFGALDDELLSEVLATCSVRRYEREEILLAEGDEALRSFLLLTGSVRVFFVSDEGTQVMVKLFRPPAFFGDMEIVAGINFIEHVAAMEPSELLIMPRETFLGLLNRSHAAALGYLRDLASRFCVAGSTEKSLAFNSVRKRLAHFLVGYVDFDGQPTAQGKRIPIRLTQDDMANALGVTRRAVAKELNRWQSEGIVVRVNGHYIVRDLDALTREGHGVQLSIHYSADRDLPQPVTSTG